MCNPPSYKRADNPDSCQGTTDKNAIFHVTPGTEIP